MEQSFLLHIVVKLALSMRVINPCVSHMPIACPFDWHASLVGTPTDVFDALISIVMFPPTSFWVNLGHQSSSDVGDSGASIAFRILFDAPYQYWSNVSSFGRKRLSELNLGDSGHQSISSNFSTVCSIPVPLACKGASTSELLVRWA